MAKNAQKINTEKSATAVLRYTRIAPRKMRLVAHMIKNTPVNEAEAQLIVHTRRPSDPLLKLLRSAIANAKEQKLDVSKLIVKEIRVDKGPMLKRWMPRAQGRATPIHKFTSHVYITLQEGEKEKKSRFVGTKIKAKKVKEPEAKPEKKTTQKTTKKQKTEIKKEPQAETKGFTQKVFSRKSV